MECAKCGCKSHEAIFIEMPTSVGWGVYCVPCFIEYQRDTADQLCDYLDVELMKAERLAEK